MDENIAIVTGLLTSPTEIRTLDSGAVIARYLLAVRSTEPRHRLDVIPVTQWNPPSEASTYSSGTRLRAVGSFQRRFWDDDRGRRTRLEVVAETVDQPDLADEIIL